jgi:hypothetical protein
LLFDDKQIDNLSKKNEKNGKVIPVRIDLTVPMIMYILSLELEKAKNGEKLDFLLNHLILLVEQRITYQED